MTVIPTRLHSIVFSKARPTFLEKFIKPLYVFTSKSTKRSTSFFGTQSVWPFVLGLMNFSRKVGLALEKTIECNRVGMTVIGLEVPHVHIHLIPMNYLKDMSFTSKVVLTDEEFINLAKKIQINFDSL